MNDIKYYIEKDFKYAIFNLSKCNRDEIINLKHGIMFSTWLTQKLDNECFEIDKSLFDLFKSISNFYYCILDVNNVIEIDIQPRSKDIDSIIYINEEPNYSLLDNYNISLIVDGFKKIGFKKFNKLHNIEVYKTDGMPLTLVYQPYVMFLTPEVKNE